MRAIARRLRRLEDMAGLGPPREPFRIIVSAVGRRLNLANSTCQRMLGRDGALTEIVELDGNRKHITDEELERFIARFPIEKVP